mmetsp:Transcript_24333/g.26998  ORF Transcript_24333/g.26998 Transcript_24333/m.26998 type:complete len:86 (+) Transcript_24333:37-294(+)
MGRHKAKARPLKKEKKKVPTIFDCPFCNHSQTVECRINKMTKWAEIKCRVCDVKYTTEEVSYLTAPIDVFSEWIDKAEEMNNRDE